MNFLLIAGTYAVSTSLVVYGIERGHEPFVSNPGRWLLTWAIIGVVLAVMSVVLSPFARKEGK